MKKELKGLADLGRSRGFFAFQLFTSLRVDCFLWFLSMDTLSDGMIL